MKTFLVLICSLALACTASGQVTSIGGGGSKKKQALAAKDATAGRSAVSQPPSVTQKSAGGRTAEAGKPTTVGKTTAVGKPTGAGKSRWEDKMKSLEAQDRAGMGMPSPDGYVGRNDGQVQQSTTAGRSAVSQPPSVTQKSAGGGHSGSSPAVQLNKFSNTTFKPTTSGASQGRGQKRKGPQVSPAPRPR
jgi:hypothetical protein